MKKILLLSIFVAAGAPVLAYDAVLKAVQGEVLVSPAGSNTFKPAKKGQQLNSNDQVKTGAGGLVQLAFKSGSTVLVKEKSRFLVSVSKIGDFISFSRGEFLIGLKKLQAGQKFRVKTPACVAAVRGTVFWGLSDADKASTYACFTGSIDVTAQGETMTLEPGQMLKVAFEEAPPVPQKADISLDYVNTFAVDGSLEGVDQILRWESGQ